MQLKNTLQVVIATDGSRTFVLFLYENILWSSTNLQTVFFNGVSHNTTIGFNAGDGVRSFTLPLSVLATDIETTSNIGVPGTYVFRVDQENITQPTIIGKCCISCTSLQ